MTSLILSLQGEELTLDYGQETESEKEQRAAVCLCGADGCRGAFLHHAAHAGGQAPPQQQARLADLQLSQLKSGPLKTRGSATMHILAACFCTWQ